MLIFLTISARSIEIVDHSPAANRIQKSYEKKSSSKGSVYHLGLGVGYVTSSEASFNEWNHSDVTGSAGGFAKFDFDSTYFIDLNFTNLQKNDNDLTLGLRYYFERKLTYKKAYPAAFVTGPTFETTYSGSDVPKIQTTELYAEVNHLWDCYFIGGGANYNFHKYHEASTFQGNVDATGGIGYHATMGWIFNSRLALKFTLRYEAIKLVINSTSPQNNDTYQGSSMKFNDMSLLVFF